MVVVEIVSSMDAEDWYQDQICDMSIVGVTNENFGRPWYAMSWTRDETK